MHSLLICCELTFAGVQTLCPCVSEFRIARASTAFEPRTTFDTTTTLSSFLDNTTFGAFHREKTLGRCNVHMLACQVQKEFLLLLRHMYFDSLVIFFLQARPPSAHVWSKFGSPGFPQLPSQAPPGAQQLSLPLFESVAHLRHIYLTAFTCEQKHNQTNTVAAIATIIRYSSALYVTNFRSKSEGTREDYCRGAQCIRTCAYVLSEVNARDHLHFHLLDLPSLI